MRDIDKIVQSLFHAHPGLVHEQFRMLHPGADDDGLWFFRHPDFSFEVQLESPNGECPFLFETSELHEPAQARTVAEAISLVAAGLGLVPSQPNQSFKRAASAPPNSGVRQH